MPELVEHQALGGTELLLTKALPALSAVDQVWGVDATRAVTNGLRRLHALDRVDCLFDWTVESRMQSALEHGNRSPGNAARRVE